MKLFINVADSRWSSYGFCIYNECDIVIPYDPYNIL